MPDLHRWAGPGIGLAFILLAHGPARAEDRKPEMPEHAYELRVTCAGAAAAAVMQAGMTTSGSDKERADARELMSETRDEALRSGDRIGRSGAEVGEAIDRSRDGILERFAKAANDPDALAKQKADLGRVVIDCALVEAVERRDAPNATPAPATPPP